MKINAKAIDKLVAQFDDCIIEELYENHEVMGNWVIITCNLNQVVEEDGTEYVDGGILDVLKKLVFRYSLRESRQSSQISKLPYAISA